MNLKQNELKGNLKVIVILEHLGIYRHDHWLAISQVLNIKLVKLISIKQPIHLTGASYMWPMIKMWVTKTIACMLNKTCK